VSEAAKALQGAIALLTKFYESPSLAHTNALALIDKELPVLRAALDDVEWTDKGLAEWRANALEKGQHLAAVQATARIAINHLQAVLNKARTFDEQQKADAAARDWLISIGSEPS
jgi:hypothetical protein